MKIESTLEKKDTIEVLDDVFPEEGETHARVRIVEGVLGNKTSLYLTAEQFDLLGRYCFIQAEKIRARKRRKKT